MHRVCCCDPLVSTCCEWQTNCTVTAPTTITINYGSTVTRHWSNGQTHPVCSYSLSVTNASAFVMRGNNCRTTSREYGANDATLTYNYTNYLYYPDVLGGSYVNGAPGACDGCNNDYTCNLDVVWCQYSREVYTGTHTVAGTGFTGPPGGCGYVWPGTALVYSCCFECECVRPTINFQPITTFWNTAADTYTYTPGCCGNPDDGFTGAGSFVVEPFVLFGACGCPDGNTWDAAFGGPMNNATCDGCYSYECEPIARTSISNKGTQTFIWDCIADSGDILNPTVNICEVTLGFYDECVQTLTVSFA